MIKAVSALTKEYNTALRKYCISKKAIMSRVLKDFFLFAMLFVLCLYMYWIDGKIPVLPIASIILVVIVKSDAIINSRRARNDLPRVIYDITVDNSKFIADSKRDVKNSTLKNTLHYEIDCDKLISVKEGGGFFFIETEPNAYIIIKYDDICEGTAEELRQILKDSLGEKYKIFDK